MALTGVYYAVFFGASAFLVVFLGPPYIKLIAYCPEIACVHSPTDGEPYWINWRTGINYHNIWIRNILPEAQLLIFGGISAMFITWAWTRKILPIGQIRVSSVNYSRGQYRLLLWILAATNILYLYSPFLSSLPSIGQLFVPVSYLVFAGFLALMLRTELPKLEGAVFFLIILPLWIFKLLESLFLTPLILIYVFSVVVWYWTRGKIPWKSSFFAITLFIAIYPLQGKVRAVIWSDETRPEISAKAVYIGEVFARNFTSWNNFKSNMLYEYGLTGLARRLSPIVGYSHVVEQTPSSVPFWAGKTFKPIFTSWIPRVLWKNKPEERSGYEFGRRYNMLNPYDGDMSINLPWITELYANFGKIGSLAGMALIGFLLGALDRAFNRPKVPVPEAIVGMTLLLPLFYQESNFSLMMGSFLPLTVFLFLYFRFGLYWRNEEVWT